MSIYETLSARKQLLITIGLTMGAFLVALPVGAHVMPGSAGAVSPATITRTVTETAGLDSCTEGTSQAASTTSSHTRHTVVTPATHTNTATNNNGATAQVGRDGVATAVNVGDVLSNNTTTVAPVTTVSPSVNLLSNNTVNGILELGTLGIL